MTDLRILDVDPTEKNERLDVFVVRNLPEFSRSHIQKMIADGQIMVQKKTVKANYKVQPNDQIEVLMPDPEQMKIIPEDIPLDILFEDQDVIVINKSRGMVVHPAPGNYQGTLVNALLKHCDDLSGINGVARPGIVHRLDKDTSGVMVVAKNDRAHINLARQIKDRAAGRKYIAIVHGAIEAEEGLIDAPIGRDATDRKRMAVTFNHSRPAKTRFRVLERYGNYSLVECRLLTGRTHQIRVHMAYIGHPVVGDPKYGPKTNHFDIKGQALHSTELTFEHPVSGETMLFSVPIPPDMQQILTLLIKRYGAKGGNGL
ncbi:MAG: rluD 3 [Firmicutes bacterium]|nr:rluD 3 [Bacillota bacterium]